jgi:type I restriction-modification system DNA methylase subunit
LRQELNDESYAICKTGVLIKGQDIGNIIAAACSPAAAMSTGCSTIVIVN